MKNKYFILLFFFLCISAKGQTPAPLEECGTQPRSKEKVNKLPFFKNSQWLIDKGREMGIPIPKDYLEKLTDKDVGRSFASYKWSEPGAGDSSDIMNAQPFPPPGPAPTGPIQYIPVQAYIWLDAAGNTPWTGQVIEQEIERCNTIYAQNNVPIRLSLICGIMVGVSDAFANCTSERSFNQMMDFPGPAAIKVHFVTRLAPNGANLSGRATRPPKYACAISPVRANSTLTHELGHCFDLDHTHAGGRTGRDSNFDCDNCYQESVSRSRENGLGCLSTSGYRKCEINGDFFCDTPADPNLQYNNQLRVSSAPTCGYDGTMGSDHWGERWVPSTLNVMSYSARSTVPGTDCRSVFTPQQVIWMLVNMPSFATTNPGYAISGPTQSCPGEILNFSVPALSGTTGYNWNVPAGWSILSGQGTRQIQAQVSSSNGSGTIRVTPNCGGAPLTRTITDKRNLISYMNGPDQICEGNYGYYSVGYVSGATYQWTVYGNLQVTSGQGTENVEIYAPYGSTGGYVSVNVNFGSCSGSTGKGISVLSGYNCYNYLAQQSADTTSATQHKNGAKANSKGRISAVESSEQQVKAPSFTVYPNPADDHLTLSFSGEKGVKYQLTDLLGRVIKEDLIKSDATVINTVELPKGVYMIIVQFESRKAFHKVVLR